MSSEPLCVYMRIFSLRVREYIFPRPMDKTRHDHRGHDLNFLFEDSRMFRKPTCERLLLPSIHCQTPFLKSLSKMNKIKLYCKNKSSHMYLLHIQFIYILNPKYELIFLTTKFNYTRFFMILIILLFIIII